MSELTALERAALTAIESSPGIPARVLSGRLHRRTQDVLRVVESLVAKSLIECRPTVRTHEFDQRGRAQSRTRPYNGLFAAAVPAQPPAIPHDPSLCPRCGARKRHFEGGPECRYICELRGHGRELKWQRVAIGPGKAIQTGEALWAQFLDRASMVDLIAAERQVRFHLDLAARIKESA